MKEKINERLHYVFEELFRMVIFVLAGIGGICLAAMFFKIYHGQTEIPIVFMEQISLYAGAFLIAGFLFLSPVVFAKLKDVIRVILFMLTIFILALFYLRGTAADPFLSPDKMLILLLMCVFLCVFFICCYNVYKRNIVKEYSQLLSNYQMKHGKIQ